MLWLLGEVEAASGAAISIYLPPDLSTVEIKKTLITTLKTEEVLYEIAEKIARSSTGAVFFYGEQYSYLVLPPFPVTEKRISSGYEVDCLRSMLERDFTIALVLVRLGAYAVGVFQGEKLLFSKVGTGLVHARHKKGGSSQRRFERHREKQIESFFTRVCSHIQDKLEPYLQQLDYVYYGGEHTTVRSFRKQCRFLQMLDDRSLKALLNVREPKQRGLEAAIGEAWISRVIQWVED